MSGPSPPSFVGSDYYCESGISAGAGNPLLSILMTHCGPRDGEDYNGLEGTCCEPPNLPWFCKELPESTNDNLEFRICGDENLSNEDTPIDLFQLYIQ